MLERPTSFVSWTSGLHHWLVSGRDGWSGLTGEKCFRNLVRLLNSKLVCGFIYWSHLQGIWWFISVDRPVYPFPNHPSHYPEYNPACQWYDFTGVFLLAPAHIIFCLYNKENYTKISIYSCNLRRLLCVSRDSFNVWTLFMYFNTGPSSSTTFMFTVSFEFLPSPAGSHTALRVEGR
jgi:hypothetical protein